MSNNDDSMMLDLSNRELLKMLTQVILGFKKDLSKTRKDLKTDIETSKQDILTLLMQEIVDVRNELKEDMSHMERGLIHRMTALEAGLKIVQSDVKTVRIEMHQNHRSFIKKSC